MSTQMDIKYKAVVLGCRSCGNQRRFIVTEDDAPYIEAQFVDGNAALCFEAYDLTAPEAEGGGVFSQSLRASDINSVQIFPLSALEVGMLRSQAERAVKVGGSVRPVTATAALTAKAQHKSQIPMPRLPLSAMLGGVKR